jgi:phenylpyruvate tautomerase PptA (4-oxalocrotonate tautomerase family)
MRYALPNVTSYMTPLLVSTLIADAPHSIQRCKSARSTVTRIIFTSSFTNSLFKMPLYEVFHTCPLTPTQQRQLAEGITTLHCTTFSAPSPFVNVTLHHYSNKEGGAKTVFVGGKEVSLNPVTPLRAVPSGLPVHCMVVVERFASKTVLIQLYSFFQKDGQRTTGANPRASANISWNLHLALLSTKARKQLYPRQDIRETVVLTNSHA